MAKQYVELWNVVGTQNKLVSALEAEDMGKALWKRLVALEVGYWRGEGYRIKTVFSRTKEPMGEGSCLKMVFNKAKEVR